MIRKPENKDSGKKGNMEKGLFSREEIKRFQIRRQIVSLYKKFLIILEDLEEDHIDNFEKLYSALKESEALIKQADYFTKEKASYLRKKVLDAGNDCIRTITGEQDDEND